MCIGPNLSFGMVTSLAFLGIVRALTIDNQVTLMKNDCYERLAIGQRINPKNVYKTFEYNTLTDCQMACTQEKSACRVFSFGIGTKGNGTCELSTDLIKETADLKPIGTVADTDYDLYTKKIGCSVVINKYPHTKPLPDDTKPNFGPGPGYDDLKPDGSHRPLPEKPPFISNFKNQHYLPPSKDEIHHVQTLVSVASGPQSYLHPEHGILIGDNPYQYGKQFGLKYYKPGGGCCEEPVKSCCSKGDRPPFRPLNDPYEKPGKGCCGNRPRPPPDDPYDLPPKDCCRGNSGPPFRPPVLHDPYERPGRDCCGKDNRLPVPFDNPYESHTKGCCGDKPPFRPPALNYPYDDNRPIYRPKPDGDGPDLDYDTRRGGRPFLGYGPGTHPKRPTESVMRPDLDRYDDFKPGRPVEDRPYGLGMRPDGDKYDDIRPGDRPYGPVNRPDGDKYDDFRPGDRPYGPVNRPNGDKYDDFRPGDRPYGPVNRPDGDKYDDIRPGDRPYGPVNRPNGDKYDDFRPGDRPYRPVNRPDGDKYDDFRPGDRPYGPVNRPDGDKYNDFRPGDRPYRPVNRPDGDKYDDFRPGDSPYGPINRPDGDKYDGFRPGDRPYGPVNRPDGDKYDQFKPSKPDRYDDDKPPRKHFRPEPQDYYLRPNFDNFLRPLPPKYGSLIPHPDEYDRRPQNSGGFPPNNDRYDTRPPKNPNYDRPNGQDSGYPGYHYDKPPRPMPDSQIYGNNKPTTPKPYLDSSPNDGYNSKPGKPGKPIDPDNPNGGYIYDKPAGGNQLGYDDDKGSGSKPIVSHSIGHHGEHITSIITELKDNHGSSMKQRFAK